MGKNKDTSYVSPVDHYRKQIGKLYLIFILFALEKLAKTPKFLFFLLHCIKKQLNYQLMLKECFLNTALLSDIIISSEILKSHLFNGTLNAD